MNNLERPAQVFSALGDSTRLALVNRLIEEGPRSITQLSHGAPVTRQAITRHLLVLRHAGVLSVARQGREQVWVVNAHIIDETTAALQSISRSWDSKIARLKNLVENFPEEKESQ